MKKLIKISDYYYVIDDKAEIKIGTWYQENNHIDEEFGTIRQFLSNDTHNPNVCCAHFIATTNPSLPLPQITNPNDDMVGKEVEVDFQDYQLENYISEIAIIKPISKETSFNSCATCKYFHTECTERQRKYNATSNNECWEENKTSTNETLEEVAKLSVDKNTTITIWITSIGNKKQTYLAALYYIRKINTLNK